MGVLIDTGVFIRWEREGRHVDFREWASYGDAAISVVSASELLVGVHRADTEQRKSLRENFVEGILSSLNVIEVNLGIARIHAMILADLYAKGTMIGPHDLWIAATARYHEYAILTTNSREFERVEKLEVLAFDPP